MRKYYFAGLEMVVTPTLFNPLMHNVPQWSDTF